MTEKWALLFDVDKCTNCANCVLAVQDEYVGNSFPGYAAEMPLHGHRWIEIKRRERGSHPMVDVAYILTTCQHCDAAPCMKAAKDGAVMKRADGIVVIDPVKSKGQKQIVAACPYGAIWWNGDLDIPQHWNFDAHLIDAGWTKPRPVQSCPTGALSARKLSDAALAELVRTEGYAQLNPEWGTGPRIYYKNLLRYDRGFVGGAIVRRVDDVEDCVAGAEVIMSRDGAIVATTRSDPFGDFKFDGLPEDGATYELSVALEGRVAYRTAVSVETSVYLGEIDVSAGGVSA